MASSEAESLVSAPPMYSTVVTCRLWNKAAPFVASLPLSEPSIAYPEFEYVACPAIETPHFCTSSSTLSANSCSPGCAGSVVDQMPNTRLPAFGDPLPGDRPNRRTG